MTSLDPREGMQAMTGYMATTAGGENPVGNAYIENPFTLFSSCSTRDGRGGHSMEESLVNVEFIKSSNRYIARIQSEIGGMREYTSNSFEEVLEQVVIDLQEEAESYE